MEITQTTLLLIDYYLLSTFTRTCLSFKRDSQAEENEILPQRQCSS